MRHVRAIAMIARITLVPLCVVLIAGCPKKTTATADCKNLERYQSTFGFLNAPELALGSVVDVDLGAKTAGKILTVVPNVADYTETQPVDSTEIISNADFGLSFDAKLPTAAEGQVKTVVQNNSLFFLKNHLRRDVIDPIGLLGKNAAQRSRLETILRDNPNHRLIFVGGVVLADEIQFRLKDVYDASAKANIIKYGNYSIQVKYSCEGRLKQYAKGAGLFFKPIMLHLNNAGNLEAAAIDFNLKEIDFNPARG